MPSVKCSCGAPPPCGPVVATVRRRRAGDYVLRLWVEEGHQTRFGQAARAHRRAACRFAYGDGRHVMVFQTNDNEILFLGDNGAVKGRVSFPDVGEGLVDITETFVAPTERGMGLAGRLMGRAATHIRSQGKKARLSCSYAQDWFGKHPEYADLVVE
ncbi:GNAT family N-acetyltransferase [Olsenella uli]|uniref:GNAT family N-acetyltransferase n=1 Tax=Olsenella uli TaxID=133926 RepID=UPI0031F590B8